MRTSTRPRALVLSMYYRPEPNFITSDVAQLLATFARVTVIAAHPNYPAGRYYPSVRRWWWPSRTIEGDVTVWRVPILLDHTASVPRRALSYLSFLFAAAALAPFVAWGARLVWVYQTPFTTAIAALWHRVVGRARLVFTCADVWPESFAASGVATSSVLMRAMYAYRRWIHRRADLVIATTDGAARQYVAEGVPADRVVCVPTWVDGIPNAASLADSPSLDADAKTIVYAGNLGPAQRLDTVVHAAAELEAAGVDVRIAFYGAGACEGELRALAARIAPRTVSFHGRVSPQQAFDVCRRSIAQIVILTPSPLFEITIPSKLTFAFAAGAPVLSGLQGEARSVALQSGGAIPFLSDEPASLAEAIRSLLAMPVEERMRMRSALRQTYLTRFSRERLLARYRELLTPLIGGPKRTCVASTDRSVVRDHLHSGARRPLDAP